MNIAEFITGLLPQSAQTREFAVKKLADKKIVSGIFFLLEAANAGDVTALMAISSLMLKEGSNCDKTRQVIKSYVEEVLRLDQTNNLARKILKSLAAAKSKVLLNSGNAAKAQQTVSLVAGEQANVAPMQPKFSTERAKSKLSYKI